mgnify:CR=1 FL=1
MTATRKTAGSYRLIVDSYGKIPETRAEWATALGMLAGTGVIRLNELSSHFLALGRDYRLPFSPDELSEMATDCIIVSIGGELRGDV